MDFVNNYFPEALFYMFVEWFLLKRKEFKQECINKAWEGFRV